MIFTKTQLAIQDNEDLFNIISAKYCNKPNSRTMLILVYQNTQKLPYTFTNTIADNIMHIFFIYK